jgi:murein DD-endopeptidase MepM/ murein hydrolase activator NlpD
MKMSKIPITTSKYYTKKYLCLFFCLWVAIALYSDTENSRPFHVVQKGETLSSISRKYDIDIVDIIDFNKLTSFLIIPGQKLWLQESSATEEPSITPEAITHTVQKGENLYRIALKYNVTVDNLRKWNKLHSVNIKEGQILYVTDVPRTPQASILKPPTSKAVLPLPVIRIISEFGMRSNKMHKGLDLGANHGTPISAVLPGTVVFAGVQKGYGNVVIIEHENSVMTVYGHNESNLVTVGNKVAQGQVIAKVGNTGNTTVYHLHFEYRVNGVARDPRELLPIR